MLARADFVSLAMVMGSARAGSCTADVLRADRIHGQLRQLYRRHAEIDIADQGYDHIYHSFKGIPVTHMASHSYREGIQQPVPQTTDEKVKMRLASVEGANSRLGDQVLSLRRSETVNFIAFRPRGQNHVLQTIACAQSFSWSWLGDNKYDSEVLDFLISLLCVRLNAYGRPVLPECPS